MTKEEKNELNLLPCPFCGNKKILLIIDYMGRNTPFYYLSCSRCHCRTAELPGYQATSSKLESMWNRREDNHVDKA